MTHEILCVTLDDRKDQLLLVPALQGFIWFDFKLKAVLLPEKAKIDFFPISTKNLQTIFFYFYALTGQQLMTYKR